MRRDDSAVIKSVALLSLMALGACNSSEPSGAKPRTIKMDQVRFNAMKNSRYPSSDDRYTEALEEDLALAEPSLKTKERYIGGKSEQVGRKRAAPPYMPPAPTGFAEGPAPEVSLKNVNGLFSNLRSPSADEISLGLEQNFGDFESEESTPADQVIAQVGDVTGLTSLSSLSPLPVDQVIAQVGDVAGLTSPSSLSSSRIKGRAAKKPKRELSKSKRRDQTSVRRRIKGGEPHQQKKEPRFGPLQRYLRRGIPARFWPSQGYFRNTYLGGDLSYREELRQSSKSFNQLMAKSQGFEWTPPLDAPREEGMTVSATLSHTTIERPQRVILQVALKGSERYGWRRPALNMMVTVDPQLIDDLPNVEAKQRALVKLILPILNRLNAADQVGVTLGRSSISPRAPSQLKEALIEPMESVISTSVRDQRWREVLSRAGESLNRRSSDPHRAPGAQAVLMICGLGCTRHLREIKSAVHKINLDGTLTSVIAHRSAQHIRSISSLSVLWKVASTGHGGFWQSEGEVGLERAVDKEFDRFSRVVARLLRLSVKLKKGVKLIEVIGSEMLNQGQVKRVKAREEAMDRRLSARLGIRSDRGEDDEGVQVVIPAFYGGDSHLIHLALWVDRPGEVAEVELKYKDMVRAINASFAQAVQLSAIPQPLTEAQNEVRRGANAHLIADQSLKMLALGESIDLLPSTPAIERIIGTVSKLTTQEVVLLNRAQLGRPQSAAW